MFRVVLPVGSPMNPSDIFEPSPFIQVAHIHVTRAPLKQISASIFESLTQSAISGTSSALIATIVRAWILYSGTGLLGTISTLVFTALGTKYVIDKFQRNKELVIPVALAGVASGLLLKNSESFGLAATTAASLSIGFTSGSFEYGYYPEKWLKPTTILTAATIAASMGALTGFGALLNGSLALVGSFTSIVTDKIILEKNNYPPPNHRMTYVPLPYILN